MSQSSFVLIYDLFSTVGKHISHVHFCFIFAKFNKHIKLLCAKLVFFRFFPIFVSWFYQHAKGLSWQQQVQTHATHHLQSDPSWISLQANHLNSSNHCTWKRRFWKLVCTTRKSYGDGVQLFNNKVLRSRSLRERPAKFPMSVILCMLGGFAKTSSLPVAQDACGCSSTGGQVGILFWHRSIKTFRGCLPWSVSHEDECLFYFTTDLSDFAQNFSLTKERRATD